MPTYSDRFDSDKATLYIDVESISPNTSNNTSVVDFTLRVTGNNASWNFDPGSYRITVDGQNYTGAWEYDFRSDNTVTLRSGTKTITHDTDGNKSIVVSGTATDAGGSPLGTATITNKTFVLDSLPGTPTAAPTLTRNEAGTTVTVVSATSGTTAAVTDYEYQQSTNNSTWGAATSMGTDATIAVAGLTATQTYYYQTRVRTADGAGPWSTSKNTLGAPATITAVRTGRNVAVTAGNATGDSITGYFVQYSTNSGSTWTSPQAMTSQAYTYNSLTPALTYLFRVYATGANGDSGRTTSAGIFVSAGGRRWTGSAWDFGVTAKRWSGSEWVDLTTAKRWNGSSWVDLS